jgi:hypothetical protein
VRLPNELVGGCERLLWLLGAYGSFLLALAYGLELGALAYGFELAACGAGAAYGLAEEGAGREVLLEALERLPKSDRFWESRSSPLSFLPRPNGMITVCLRGGECVVGCLVARRTM